MALGEALSCGVPAIAAECSRGIRELMRDGLDGVVIPPDDTEALTAEMGRLMSDKAERERLASHAPDIVNRFSLDKVIDQWEDLMADSLQGSSATAVSVS